MGLRAPALRRRAAGFSLIEIAIVLAVIAVLGTVIIGSRGYLAAARRKTAVDMVHTLRDVSRQFAMRHQGGIRFANPADLAGPDSVGLKQLRAEGLVPDQANLKTPWGGTSVAVTAVNAPQRCADFTCVRIDLGDVPEDDCEDLRKAFEGRVVSVSCAGTRLSVVTR